MEDSDRGLAPLVGHEALRSTLARGVVEGSLPATLLIHGPAGGGKQRLALWLGQLLLCERPTPEGPCNACTPCRQARRIEHPDLHWFFPLARPKGASSPEKLKAALEDARHQEIAEWRKHPVRATRGSDVTGIYVAAVKTLRGLATKRPATGSRHVFVIGRAERLVPQEASQEAANALLKLLEEPPDGTTLILTSSEAEQLLPTIRSRAVPIHLPCLPRPEVSAFLQEFTEAEAADIERATWLSGGSIGKALGYLPDGDEHGPLEQARRDSFTLLRAALGDPAGPYAQAGARSPAKARTLMPLLDHLGIWLRDMAALAVGAKPAVVNVDASDALTALLAGSTDVTQFSRCLDRVEHARVVAQGNVNPQLIVFGLLHEIREALSTPNPSATPSPSP